MGINPIACARMVDMPFLRYQIKASQIRGGWHLWQKDETLLGE